MAKNLPIFLIIIFSLWTIIDQKQLKKISAEEIGQNSLLNHITKNPEDYEGQLVITEGPLENQPTDNLSYLDEEAIKPNVSPEQSLTQGLSFVSQEDTVLVAPLPPGLESVVTRTETIEYIVESGDSVSTIAQKFNISTNTILWVNNLSSYSLIKPGQKLKILPTTGINHKVASGENLSAIAKKYQAEVDDIIEFNKLVSLSDIQIGQNLIIPAGIKPVTYVPKPQPTITSIFTPPSASVSGSQLQWPIDSHYITQYYGWRHSGLDIAGDSGIAIYAAENGKVERAGWTSGYGYNIIINHGNGLKTLYAHCSKMYVSVGQSVARGETIAGVGSTGWSTGPHLHFEVRVSSSRVNPLSYIR